MSVLCNRPNLLRIGLRVLWYPIVLAIKYCLLAMLRLSQTFEVLIVRLTNKRGSQEQRQELLSGGTWSRRRREEPDVEHNLFIFSNCSFSFMNQVLNSRMTGFIFATALYAIMFHFLFQDIIRNGTKNN